MKSIFRLFSCSGEPNAGRIQQALTLLLLVFAALGALGGCGGGTRGTGGSSITGKIHDPGGTLISDAVVTIIQSGEQDVSDEAGSFDFETDLSGDLTLQIDAPGAAGSVQLNVPRGATVALVLLIRGGDNSVVIESIDIHTEDKSGSSSKDPFAEDEVGVGESSDRNSGSSITDDSSSGIQTAGSPTLSDSGSIVSGGQPSDSASAGNGNNGIGVGIGGGSNGNGVNGGNGGGNSNGGAAAAGNDAPGNSESSHGNGDGTAGNGQPGGNGNSQGNGYGQNQASNSGVNQPNPANPHKPDKPTK